MRTPNSLIKRLWLASALCLPVIVGASAFALQRAFVQSLDAAEEDAMLAQVYALIAIADIEDKALVLPSYSIHPKLETHRSGLYARVFDANTTLAWQSNSLESSALDFSHQAIEESGKPYFRFIKKGHDTAFRSLSFVTLWDIDGEDRAYTFEVFQSQNEKAAEVQHYRRALMLWLGGMTLLLLVVQSAIVKWGLMPLTKLASEIEQIEQGSASHLHASYPEEILPVTRSLDKLLRSEDAQRERYKNALSNLAHSLKTPLAVIRAQLGSDMREATQAQTTNAQNRHDQNKHNQNIAKQASINTHRRAIDDQISNMSAIIDHQLKRANAEVTSVYGPQTDLASVSDRICRALQKIHRDTRINCTPASTQSLTVQMQEQDVMEVLGNIIENACKYSETRVEVRFEAVDEGVHINVEDDGTGVPEHIRSQILARGARADTSTHGQGIGLAVAMDILSSYNGGLEIQSSALGGARFNIFMPSHRSP